LHEPFGYAQESLVEWRVGKTFSIFSRLTASGCNCLNARCSFTERTPCSTTPPATGLLKTLENNPSLSQRDLAKRLGISLGKVNICRAAHSAQVKRLIFLGSSCIYGAYFMRVLKEKGVPE
jgi:hypothetical protein